MENYKRMCEKLNINFKKDMILTIIIAVLFISIAIVAYKLYTVSLGIIIFVLALLYLFLHYFNIKASFTQLTNAKEIAFNGFYRYVITLLKNKNVLYGALQASLEYVDEVLVNDVTELINDIENDVSIEPFFKFMGNFEDETIKQMILLLYKTQDVGIIDDVIESINECIVNLQDTSIQTYIKKEENKIQKFYIFPIVLSAIVMIIVSLFVFTLLGEGIYV